MNTSVDVVVDSSADSAENKHDNLVLPLKRPRPRRVSLQNISYNDQVEGEKSTLKPRRIALTKLSSVQKHDSSGIDKLQKDTEETSISSSNNNKSKLELAIERLEEEESLKTKPRTRDVVYTKVPRFVLSEIGSNKSAMAFFRENGFVVYGNVLSEDQNKKALELMWDYLEGLDSGIVRNKPETYTDERWPPEIEGGILPWLGIGQSKMQWYLRSCHGVQLAFADLWNCECKDLVTSFDGICVFREDRTPRELRFHVDQNPERSIGFECIQGLVNLLPTSRESGGNTVIPKSHLEYFEKLKIKYPEEVKGLEGEDHFEIPINDSYLEEARHDQRCVVSELKAGDMLLWDSRTIHRNSTSLDMLASISDANTTTQYPCTGDGGIIEEHEDQKLKQAFVPCLGLKRIVSFVCMVPKAKLSSEIIEKRKLAVNQNITTSHWPTQLIDTRCYGSWEMCMKPEVHRFKAPQPPGYDDLTPDQRRLIG